MAGARDSEFSKIFRINAKFTWSINDARACTPTGVVLVFQVAENRTWRMRGDTSGTRIPVRTPPDRCSAEIRLGIDRRSEFFGP
jgi:hypothetical protein